MDYPINCGEIKLNTGQIIKKMTINIKLTKTYDLNFKGLARYSYFLGLAAGFAPITILSPLRSYFLLSGSDFRLIE